MAMTGSRSPIFPPLTDDGPPARREWTRFRGRILHRTDREVTLEPETSQGAHLVVRAEDMRQDGHEIRIRPGSRFLRLIMVNLRIYRALPIGPPTMACPNGTRCIGHVRYCCGGREEVGPCNADSHCPDDD
jgi:hypothetical protein